MRLDKYVAQTAELSRALVKVALRHKRVTVNGLCTKDAGLAISDDDVVALDGAVLRLMGPRYFMLHKPMGYLCATTDPMHATVLDLLHEPNKHRLHIAGRLDIDTTGLVLITDDGHWSHRVTSPRYECEKVYLATLAEPLVGDAEAKLRAGIQLHHEKQLTKPATLERLTDTCVRVTISEGKYHQVKRMFAALNNRVIALHRERIGDIGLEATLAEGTYRALSAAEVRGLASAPCPK